LRVSVSVQFIDGNGIPDTAETPDRRSNHVSPARGAVKARNRNEAVKVEAVEILWGWTM
jgi:hypothetical protein